MAKPFLQCHRRFKNGKDHCYWSIAEKVRTHRGWVQRHLLYLGEINDSQKEAWTKVINVFDTEGQQTRELALYPAGRQVPEHAAQYGVQVRLNEFELRRPRQWGACWVGCHVWDQLQLDEFWQQRLPDSREGTSWRNVLKTLTIYRLIDPGSEWRLHREWFKNSALADLLGEDFSLAQKDNLYRCLDKLLEHRPALFQHLRRRWEDLFGVKFEVLLYRKAQALVMATRVIDAEYEFGEFKVAATQGLQWPRYSCPDLDGTAGAEYLPGDQVPKGVFAATCEMARELLIADRTAAPAGEGLDSVQTTHSTSGSGGSSTDSSNTKYNKAGTVDVGELWQPKKAK